MKGNSKTEIRAYGLRLLLSRHPEVQRLKRTRFPSVHGNKHWSAGWLLMDYLRRRGLKPGSRVMDVGCGWGLVGIYCAKRYGAKVTAVDKDPEVFPYLRLHAEINGVEVATLRRAFSGLTEKDLQDVDVMIGADICFWDMMVEPLKTLVRRALRAGVPLILVADPGRSPFEAVSGYFVDKWDGELLSWTAQRPRRIQGQILRIGHLIT